MKPEYTNPYHVPSISSVPKPHQGEPLTRLSIIVPVYNVEPYIDTCIRSITDQVVPDMEVILVDDGSTDGSGELCDRYAQQYPYFKVIHQPNGGLSSARNTGLEHAQGDYVFFVDSDDYLDRRCLSHCMKAIEDTACDVVMFSYHQVDEHGAVVDNDYYLSRFPSTQTVDGTEALRFLLEERYQNIAWDMISKRAIWSDHHIAFPVGKKYEDVATTYKVLAHAGKVRLLHESLYKYVQRSSSITHALTAQALRDQLEAFTTRSRDIARDMPTLRGLCDAALYKAHYATVTASTMAERTPEVKRLSDISTAYLRSHKRPESAKRLFSPSQQVILRIILAGMFPVVGGIIRTVKRIRKRN